MCNITFDYINDKLNIFFDGLINSNNADQVEKDVFEVFKNEGASNEEVALDFLKLSYISSAGLRILLKIKKTYPGTRIINANSEVFDVLEMTGFTSIIPCSRVLQEISIEGLTQIGEGYMGKVYRLDEERIVKVFLRIDSPDDIYRERKMAKQAFVLGIPTAISYQICRIKETGGFGSIFELLKSDCFNKVIANNPGDYQNQSKLYVNLLKTIITTKVEDGVLPDKKDDARQWFNGLRSHNALPSNVISKLENMLEALPDTHTLVHGDFHVKNIMMQGDEPILIDMETLGHGHPIFEYAAFFLSYIGYPSTEEGNVERFLGIPYETGIKLYEDAIRGVYTEKNEEEIDEMKNKIALLGYAWLLFKTLTYEPENKARYDHSKEVVLSLIDKVDNFDF